MMPNYPGAELSETHCPKININLFNYYLKLEGFDFGFVFCKSLYREVANKGFVTKCNVRYLCHNTIQRLILLRDKHFNDFTFYSYNVPEGSNNRSFLLVLHQTIYCTVSFIFVFETFSLKCNVANIGMFKLFCTM